MQEEPWVREYLERRSRRKQARVGYAIVLLLGGATFLSQLGLRGQPPPIYSYYLFLIVVAAITFFLARTMPKITFEQRFAYALQCLARHLGALSEKPFSEDVLPGRKSEVQRTLRIIYDGLKSARHDLRSACFCTSARSYVDEMRTLVRRLWTITNEEKPYDMTDVLNRTADRLLEMAKPMYSHYAKLTSEQSDIISDLLSKAKEINKDLQAESVLVSTIDRFEAEEVLDSLQRMRGSLVSIAQLYGKGALLVLLVAFCAWALAYGLTGAWGLSVQVFVVVLFPGLLLSVFQKQREER